MIVSGGTITAAAGLEIIYIKLNGELLIDPSYLDTVTDTPLMNYAVLNEGTNGNLVGDISTTGSLTYIGETGTNYYYEADGVGVTATGPVPNVEHSNNVAYNFGQQPFAASNIISYDQATGVVELPLIQPYDERANTDQVWSTNGGDLNDPHNVYNGTQENGGTLSNATTVKTFLQNQSISNVSSLSVAAGTGGEMEFFVNECKCWYL